MYLSLILGDTLNKNKMMSNKTIQNGDVTGHLINHVVGRAIIAYVVGEGSYVNSNQNIFRPLKASIYKQLAV